MKAERLTSLLFVPGGRPDRFGRALESGAGAVCIDLEDSVPANGKDAARRAALEAIAAESRLALRINPVTTLAGLRDLVAIADAGARPALLLVPKVESPADVAVVRGALACDAIVPLIESPAALRRVAAIAGARGVAAMMFGGGDLSAELGVALAWKPLAPARGLFLLGCAEAGVPTIDVPWLALDDEAGLAAETVAARDAGFAAKAAIHPAQVAVIDRILRPSAAEVEEARAAEAAFAEAGGAAVRFRGRMLEEPVMRRYRRMLAQTHDNGSLADA